MLKNNPDFKSRFRILKGGKVSLVVSAMVLGSFVATPSNAADFNSPVYYLDQWDYNDTVTETIDVDTNDVGNSNVLGLYIDGDIPYSVDYDITLNSTINVDNTNYSSSYSYLQGIEIEGEDRVGFNEDDLLTLEGYVTVTSNSDFGEDDADTTTLGLLVDENYGSIINSGNIVTESDVRTYEDLTSSNATASSDAWSTGMASEYNSGLIKNEDTITVTSDTESYADSYTTASSANSEAIADSSAFGMTAAFTSTESELVNTGDINVTADAYAAAESDVNNITTNYSADADAYAYADAYGMSVMSDNEGSILNNGTINVEAITDTYTYADGSSYPNPGEDYIVNPTLYGSEYTYSISSAEATGIYVGEDNIGDITNDVDGVINVTATSLDNDWSYASGIEVGEDNLGNIANNGTMNVTSNDGEAYGIEVVGINSENSAITNGADAVMTVSADQDAFGINIGDDNYGVITNSGTIDVTSDYDNAFGITVEGNGNYATDLEVSVPTITNALGASIVVDGDEDSFGIFVWDDNYGVIDNKGSIDVTSDYDNAFGITLEEGDNYGTIINSGSVEVTSNEDYAYGIYMYGGNGDEYTDLDVYTPTILNDETGTIKVTSAIQDAYGIYVEDDNYGVIDNKGSIEVTSTSIDADAYGILIQDGDNYGAINSHDLKVTAEDDAYGIAIGLDDVNDNYGVINNTGDMTITSNTEDAIGIYTSGGNGGDTFTNLDVFTPAITNALGATITVTADADAYGILIEDDNYGVIDNKGSIVVASSGEDAAGVDVYEDNYGTIENSGSIKVTANDHGDGIDIGDNYGIIDSNIIEVTAYSGHGIYIDDSNYSEGEILSKDITLTLEAGTGDAISLGGDNYGVIDSEKITATSTDDGNIDGIDVDEDNYGTITSKDMTLTSGWDATGIEVDVNGAYGEDAVITSTGIMNITAVDTAEGIATMYNGEDAVITNSGTMNIESTVYGEAYGILVNDNLGSIKNTGTINALSEDTDEGAAYAYGISVGEDSFYIESKNMDIEAIAHEGAADAYGISVGEDNLGDIKVTGDMVVSASSEDSDADAYGVFVGEVNTDGIEVQAGASIDVSAQTDTHDQVAYASGIYVDFNVNGADITNNGDITVDATNTDDSDTNAYAEGIYTLENDGLIKNAADATITATIDGVADYRAYSIVTEDSSEGTVENNGTLDGNLDVFGTLDNNGNIILPWNANNSNDHAYVETFNNNEDGTLTISLNNLDLGDDVDTMNNAEDRYSQLEADTVTFENDSTIHVNVMSLDRADQVILDGEVLDDVVETTNSLDFEGDELGGDINVTDNSDILDFYIDTVALSDDSSSIDLNVKVKEIDSVDSHIATSIAAAQMLDSIYNVVDDRQRELGNQGISSGDATAVVTSKDSNLWIKPFYSYGNQSAVDNTNGFEIDAHGAGIGMDTKVGTDSSFGLAFFYTKADLEFNDTYSSDAEAENYSAIAYGSTSLNEANTAKFIYQLGYSYQDNLYNRTIESVESGTGIADIAGDYNSSVASLSLGIIGESAINDTLTARPMIEAKLRRFETAGFTETSSQTSAIYEIDDSINYQSVVSVGTMFESKIGDSSKFVTDLRAGFDFSHDEGIVDAKYVGATNFEEIETIDNGGFVYNLGFLFETEGENSVFNIGYDLEGQGADYQNHMISTKLVFKF